jgi:chitin synthase
MGGATHQYWQDDVDERPMLAPGGSYGPDPHNIDPVGSDLEAGYADPPPPAANAPIRRWKTVKEVQLFNGNLVLDCPVPPRLLNQIQHAQPPERDEFTHMRYSAATCDPSEFYDKRFTLRQRLFAKPRHTELFIVVTMYNEEDELFARTMIGVIKNIEYMNSRTSSKTWGKEAWKKDRRVCGVRWSCEDQPSDKSCARSHGRVPRRHCEATSQWRGRDSSYL